MCGICGIVDFRHEGEDFGERLERMNATLRHRGPDQDGIWTSPHVGLGHTRLSIIDVSDGRQPLGNEDGSVWISFNGEVYNFQELRAELLAKGHRFRTRTDTEVIVHLYEEEGIACAKRLRGMFAFGIWDGRSGAMYLVRDQVGVKPLYYTLEGGRLIFGSEIKAILAHGGVRRRVRADALWDYLTFSYVPAPKTMFENIYKLPAGHWLRFDRQGASCQEYWDLEPGRPLGCDGAEVEGELIERLGRSVREQMISDVPLGAFLSGGVDSSAVVAMMHRAGARPLVTTSVGFEESAYNELPFARQVAGRYETDHHEEVIRPEAAGVVEKLAWHYDEPFADFSSVPTYYVSRAARRHVTVALSGDGGDENFAGYRRYRFDLAERRARRMIPAGLRRWLVRPLAAMYPKFDWLPRRLRAKVTLGNIAADEADAYCRSVGFLSEAHKRALVRPEVAARLKGYRSADIIGACMAKAKRSDLNQLLYTDIKTYLVDDILTKVDRASMAVSLEVRVPLLDHTFMEYAHRIDPGMKIAGGQGKRIFKSALEPYVGKEVLYRPKQGFTPPIVEWLRGPLAPMVGDLLLGGQTAYAEYIEPRVIRRAWSAHQSGRSDNAALIWAVLMFELWAGRFLKEETTGNRQQATGNRKKETGDSNRFRGKAS